MRIKQIVLVIIVLAAIFACKPKEIIKRVVVKEPVIENKIIITDEMKDYLKKNKNASIVLRVLSADLEDVNMLAGNKVKIDDKDKILKDIRISIYDAIEEELVKAGFSVRDRSLLQNVYNLEKGVERESYAEIKNKIETDLIFEVSEINFNEKYDGYNNCIVEGNGEIVNFTPNNQLVTTYATLKYKMIIIEKNSIGIIGNYVLQPCSGTDGCGLAIKQFLNENKIGFYNPADGEYYEQIIFYVNTIKTRLEIANDFGSILANDLKKLKQ